MMVYYRLYWTLWILSCFGQYFSQDLQIPEPPNKAEGESVVFTPDNPPPSTSILVTQWFFGTTTIITVLSSGTTVTPEYEGRADVDSNTFALTLQNLRLSDSGIYELRVTTAGGTLIGQTSLQVFVCLNGEGEVYDLYCIQPPGGDQRAPSFSSGRMRHTWCSP